MRSLRHRKENEIFQTEAEKERRKKEEKENFVKNGLE